MGVRMVGDPAKDIDLSASLAIGDEETRGLFLALTWLFRQLHGILIVAFCCVICSAVLFGSVIMTCRFGRVFAKEYS